MQTSTAGTMPCPHPPAPFYLPSGRLGGDGFAALAPCSATHGTFRCRCLSLRQRDPPPPPGTASSVERGGVVYIGLKVNYHYTSR